MLSRTVAFWIQALCGQYATVPLNRTDPAVRRISPIMPWSNDDFPEPTGPVCAEISFHSSRLSRDPRALTNDCCQLSLRDGQVNTFQLESLLVLRLSYRWRWNGLLILLLALLVLPGGSIWRRPVPDELGIHNLDCVLQLLILYRGFRQSLGLEDAIETLRRVVCISGRAQCQSW